MIDKNSSELDQPHKEENSIDKPNDNQGVNNRSEPTNKNNITINEALEVLDPKLETEGKKQEVPKSLFFAYLALVLGLFTVGVGTLIGLVISYVKRGDYPAGSFEDSHYKYIQRSFWFSLLWTLLIIPTFLLAGIGALLIWIPGVWWIYRVIKGCIRAADGTNMYK